MRIEQINSVPGAPLCADADDFVRRIEARQATIAVIGLGYVGLPLVVGFHARGFAVIGVDIDPAKIQALNEGRSYIQHISSERLHPLTRERFKATTDFSALSQADAILICVPTPLTKYLEPDMYFVCLLYTSPSPRDRS